MITHVCSKCGKVMEHIRNPGGSMLNDDQFAATRCGDWYCDDCRQYYFERDGILRTSDYQSRTSLRPKADPNAR